MTATDELRRMLDEAGVEYEADDDVTRFFDADGMEVVLQEDMDGKLDCLTPLYLTPEQAIAATVGPETCYAYETEPMSCSCNDVQLYNGKWVTGLPLTVHVMKCSACGGTYEYVNGGYEYCPRCGRKVVDE